MLIIGENEVNTLLVNKESEIIDLVKLAYEIHNNGQSSLPHSLFLRFPNDPKNRIIALPAYLGGNFAVAGIKWIASFPDNLKLGIKRASAAIILNSVETGRPFTLIEGSIISAKRTAASAALAAKFLQKDKKIITVGIIGCGAINFEIVRFLLNVYPNLEELIIYDIIGECAEKFKLKCNENLGLNIKNISIVSNIDEVLESGKLISVATTAIKPHINNISKCVNDSTILHISLRDFTPEVILQCINVVDDISHVCRAQTSIHLTEELVGNWDFILGTLTDITLNKVKMSSYGIGKNITIFSPFGLGVLDIALAKLVYERAIKNGIGINIDSFII